MQKMHTRGTLQTLNRLRESGSLELVMSTNLLATIRSTLPNLMRAGQTPVERRRWFLPRTLARSPTEAAGMHKQLSDQQRQVADLPINAMKDQILDMIQNSTYSIIVAEAGAGKSSQLPQMLLDHAIAGSAADCKIFCVQPYRIAASSLARRVASERGEELGQSIEYKIQIEDHLGKFGVPITYCTAGALLQQLQLAPSLLDSVSYIILDEVHERTIDIDLTMFFLRKLIDERRIRKTHTPKVVIMSATPDTDRIASYFGEPRKGHAVRVPYLYIPSSSHLAKKQYLDDLLPSLQNMYPESISSPYLQEHKTRTYLGRHYFQSKKKKMVRNLNPTKSDLTSLEDDHFVPIGLVCLTISYVLSTTDKGAILVFLPGLPHITEVHRTLRQYGKGLGIDFADPGKIEILRLYSNLPDSYDDVFSESRPGCRRIILATDIVETSVTLPDVRYVIDTGKTNRRVYDPQARFSRPLCQWVSQSNLARRAGWAERVQGGGYFALYPRSLLPLFHANPPSEISHDGLQNACLIAKKADPSTQVEVIMEQLIEPPGKARVNEAIQNLQYLRAMNLRNHPTVLGDILSEIPLDPCHGKLILLGVIFRCLDPLIILAALGGDLALFHTSRGIGRRAASRDWRIEYSENSWSDHISAINAFKSLRKVWYQQGIPETLARAFGRSINYDRFREVLDTAQETHRILVRAGIIPQHFYTDDAQFRFGGPEMNVNSHHVALIKALILQSTYPNLAAPVRHDDSLYRTRRHNKSFPHGFGVNSITPLRCMLTYNKDYTERFIADRVILGNTSHLTPLAACLFGGRLRGTSNTLCMDEWLEFSIRISEGSEEDSEQAAKELIEFRKALGKVSRSPDLVFSLPLTNFTQATITAFKALTIPYRNVVQNSPPPKSNVTRDFILDTVSKSVVDVLDRDDEKVPIAAHAQPGH